MSGVRAAKRYAVPAWDVWLQRHGVDPADVPDGGRVYVADDTRQVLVPDWEAPTVAGWVVALKPPYQLEAAALPFPTVCADVEPHEGHERIPFVLRMDCPGVRS